jgi:hypothetical protein
MAEKLISFRPLNVVLRPRSKALKAYGKATGVASRDIASGFKPRPDLDLTYRGGKTIADLVFVHCYLGGASKWRDDSRSHIDSTLADLMSDPALEKVIGQYYHGAISSRMLPSHVVSNRPGPRFYKDKIEALVKRLARQGVTGDADPASTVICLILPPGVVLVDGNSDGSEAEHDGDADHRRRAFVLVDDEQVDSKHGLGGFHGSVHYRGATYYYAISVWSEGDNGIPAFDRPWKNVVATLYHELCEARTDPDVEDVIKTGVENKLGWYSNKGGEIGDIPMMLAGADLSEVMVEEKLGDGTVAPLQLQWSNKVHGPEGR